jgi:membrane protein insertase Oxa1/YidC/SpoIIIJ
MSDFPFFVRIAVFSGEWIVDIYQNLGDSFIYILFILALANYFTQSSMMASRACTPLMNSKNGPAPRS